jgi:hypothetical protein
MWKEAKQASGFRVSRTFRVVEGEQTPEVIRGLQRGVGPRRRVARNDNLVMESLLVGRVSSLE